MSTSATISTSIISWVGNKNNHGWNQIFYRKCWWVWEKTFRHLDERVGTMIVSDEGCLCNNKTSQSWENKKQNNQMTAVRVIRHWGFKNRPLPRATRWKLDLICYGDQCLGSYLTQHSHWSVGHQNTSTLSVITMIHDTWSADDSRHYQQIRENQDFSENNHTPCFCLLSQEARTHTPHTPTEVLGVRTDRQRDRRMLR